MNSYYVQFSQNYEGEFLHYGYTFKDKDMFHARLHARNMAKQAGFTMGYKVWRISHIEHAKLYNTYRLPSPIPETIYEEETNGPA